MLDELFIKKMKSKLNKLTKEEIIDLFIQFNLDVGNNLKLLVKSELNYKKEGK